MNIRFYNPPISNNIFENVEYLDMGDCELIEIPKWINSCINATTLLLTYNKITKIENIDKLIRLRKLDIAFNEIIKLENIQTLQVLEDLDIYYNLIGDITELHNISSLKLLDIRCNGSGNGTVKGVAKFKELFPNTKIHE